MRFRGPGTSFDRRPLLSPGGSLGGAQGVLGRDELFGGLSGFQFEPFALGTIHGTTIPLRRAGVKLRAVLLY